MNPKTLVVFSHFDCENKVDDYVVYYLSRLAQMGFDVVFVSTSDLGSDERDRIRNHCLKVICRENSGYDFYSYKVGLLESGISLDSYQNVVLCNDSVYGPLRDLSGLFRRMEAENCDVWGLVESEEIERHLQSFFLVFRRAVLDSGALGQFFNEVEVLQSKREVIDMYEIGLSRQMIARGFKLKGCYSGANAWRRFQVFLRVTRSRQYSRSKTVSFAVGIARMCARILRNTALDFIEVFIQGKANRTHQYWDDILRKGVPFVKVDLLRSEVLGARVAGLVLDRINATTDYPVEIIRNHVLRTRYYYSRRCSPERAP